MARMINHTNQSVLVAIALMAVGLLSSGCKADHPDEKPAVVSALVTNGVYSVMVAEDRRSGVMTLSGDVGSPGVKTQAESVAGKAAPDYTIANSIHVVSIGITAPAPSSGGGD